MGRSNPSRRSNSQWPEFQEILELKFTAIEGRTKPTPCQEIPSMASSRERARKKDPNVPLLSIAAFKPTRIK
ncbi:unnamed protein product [Prunus armeniaca]